MKAARTRRLNRLLFWSAIALSLLGAVRAQKQAAAFNPVIPKTWDEEALASLEVPLADPRYSPKDISAEDYYRLPVRPIYKSYPKISP